VREISSSVRTTGDLLRRRTCLEGGHAFDTSIAQRPSPELDSSSFLAGAQTASPPVSDTQSYSFLEQGGKISIAG
jgi:hypothetical protein